MVVVEILGVVYDVPVAKAVPPVDAAHQLIVPALAVAERASVPEPQTDAGVVPVIVGNAVTVIVLLCCTAAHPPLVVKVKVIFPVAPFAVYVAPATFVALLTVPELAVQVPPVAPPPIDPPKPPEVAPWQTDKFPPAFTDPFVQLEQAPTNLQ